MATDARPALSYAIGYVIVEALHGIEVDRATSLALITFIIGVTCAYTCTCTWTWTWTWTARAVSGSAASGHDDGSAASDDDDSSIVDTPGKQLSRAAANHQQPQMTPAHSHALGRKNDPRQDEAVRHLPSFRERVHELPDLSAKALSFLTDDTLLRYLRARDSDEKKALSMLKATLAWRSQHLDHLDCAFHRASPCEACAKDPKAHSFFTIGNDDRSWPVVYACAARSTSRNVEGNALHMAYELERLFGGNNSTPGKYTWLLDFSGMGMFDVSPRMATTGVAIFMGHYPERMGEILLLNPPSVFQVLYNAALPLLDAVTKEKITFLRDRRALEKYAAERWTTDKAMADWLKVVLDADALPAKPGRYPAAAINDQLSDPVTRAYLARIVP